MSHIADTHNCNIPGAMRSARAGIFLRGHASRPRRGCPHIPGPCVTPAQECNAHTGDALMRAGDGTGGNRRPRRRGSHLGAYRATGGNYAHTGNGHTPGATTPAPAKVRHRGQLRPHRHSRRSFCHKHAGQNARVMQKVWLAPTLCSVGALSLCRAGVRTLVSDHPAILVRVRCPLGHPALILAEGSRIRVHVGLDGFSSPPRGPRRGPAPHAAALRPRQPPCRGPGRPCCSGEGCTYSSEAAVLIARLRLRDSGPSAMRPVVEAALPE